MSREAASLWHIITIEQARHDCMPLTNVHCGHHAMVTLRAY